MVSPMWSSLQYSFSTKPLQFTSNSLTEQKTLQGKIELSIGFYVVPKPCIWTALCVYQLRLLEIKTFVFLQ